MVKLIQPASLSLIGSEGRASFSLGYSQGGGVEDYSCHILFNDNTVTSIQADLPWGSTPEEIWKALSDLGKDEVRKQGMDNMFMSFGKFMAKVMVLIGFKTEDRDFLNQSIALKQAAARTVFEKALAQNDARAVGDLANIFSSIALMQDVVTVYENLDEYLNSSIEQGWKPPTTNS